MTENNHTEALSKLASGPLATPGNVGTIGALTDALLRIFPREDALSWDKMGLLVGDPSKPISKVALALDPTVRAVKQAADQGANVLITHHPAFLDAPDQFGPGRSQAENPGAVVWEAISAGVALVNFHTALDVSPRVQHLLPGMLGLEFSHIVDPVAPGRNIGFGQYCKVKPAGEPLTVELLGARCTAVFGRQPRVWGTLSRRLSSIVTFTGSCTSDVDCAYEAGADCVVCGEIKYHKALELADAGMAIIELGHDVSELPLVAVLAEAVLQCRVAHEDLILIDQTHNWNYPEAVRV